MFKCHLAPLKEQDKLANGFLKTNEGRYLPIGICGVEIDDSQEIFAFEQDRLDEGLLKLEESREYIHINKLEEVTRFYMGDECFVATSVYGSRDAPQVQALRELRDNCLMKTPTGRAFVRAYYSGLGKLIARIIIDYTPFLIPLFQGEFDCLARRHLKKKNN